MAALARLSRVLMERRGRVVVEVTTPAGWMLTLRERRDRFHSTLTHPNGDEISRGHWQADAHDAIELALTALAVRDRFQSSILRALVREELRK
jgi:hypothetical protein